MQKLLTLASALAAAAVLSTTGLQAKDIDYSGKAKVTVTTRNHSGRVDADDNARLNTGSVRHRNNDNAADDMNRPPGWNHGRKTGWHCTVGTRGCVPPGWRRHHHRHHHWHHL